MSAQPYQLLPPLTPDEREALRESIATFGVLHPVVTDEAGAVIDGHHRAEVADELGIEYQTIVLPGLTEEQKVEQALALNLGRRHLSPEQKAHLVAELKTRGLSVRWISEKTGIPRSTVHRLGGVPDGTPGYVTGQDGKRYRAVRLKSDAGRLREELRRDIEDLFIKIGILWLGRRLWRERDYVAFLEPILVAGGDPEHEVAHLFKKMMLCWGEVYEWCATDIRFAYAVVRRNPSGVDDLNAMRETLRVVHRRGVEGLVAA